MNRPAGIETEYGLNCEGFAGEPDFAYEAARLIQAAPVEGAFRGWDYVGEDPYRDLRGGRADRLERDPRDLTGSTDRSSRMSRDELLSNTVLRNGARLYNDHNHPEYCTDVCLSLKDLVAQDKVGERVMFAAETARNAALGYGQIRLLKNNTDYHGRSYGCHENYLTPRNIPTSDLIRVTVPFLATRQVFVGAGRVGIEKGDAWRLQMSQRADFFEEVTGINTTARRPIFNTRDEPHADAGKYRRLHVIAGDANRSEWATAMKAGTTALTLDLAMEGWRPSERLTNPVRAVRRVSHDLDFGSVVDLERGGPVSALDVQRWYCEAAQRYRGRDTETTWVLDEWAAVLDDLGRDRALAADRVDWVAKECLIDEMRADFGSEWRDGDARRIDMGYHVLDPDLCVYDSLVAEGRMRRIVSDADIERALETAPAGTRATVRGDVLRRFGEDISAVEWDRIVFRRNGYDVTLRFDDVVGPTVDRLGRLVAEAETLDGLLTALDAEGR